MSKREMEIKKEIERIKEELYKEEGERGKKDV